MEKSCKKKKIKKKIMIFHRLLFLWIYNLPRCLQFWWISEFSQLRSHLLFFILILIKRHYLDIITTGPLATTVVNPIYTVNALSKQIKDPNPKLAVTFIEFLVKKSSKCSVLNSRLWFWVQKRNNFLTHSRLWFSLSMFMT